MSDSSRLTGGKSLFALAFACAALLTTATAANAADFCVGSTPGGDCPAGGTTYAGNAGGLASAISDSLVAPGTSDKIYIESGTYAGTGGWDLGTGNNISLIGVGPTRPLLTVATPAAASAKTLTSSSGSVSISNLAVEAAAVNFATAIKTNLGSPQIKDVTITGPGATNSVGIDLIGQGATLQRISIDLPPNATASDGITTSAASSLLISDVNVIQATRGISLTNGTNNAEVQRVRVSARQGINFTDSYGTVSSSLIVTPANPGVGMVTGIQMGISSGDYTTKPVNSFNNTIVGNGVDPSSGLVSETSSASSIAKVMVNSTVVVGHSTAFEISAVPSSTALMNVDYSRFTGATGAATLGTQASSLAGDPLFANPAGGDYSLQKASPLVDAGDPGALAGSGSDLAGNPRIASRGAGNIRDIGAYELSNSAPVANLAIVTPIPVTTAPTTFSGSGSTDADGDAMSFAWKFDTSQFSNGETVSRTLVVPGVHTVQLTVTDSTGAASVTTTQFTVEKGAFSLTLNKKPIRATGKGNFSVKLFCPDQASSNCNGKLLFQTTAKRPLKAASYVFSVEPGTTRKLPITTTKSFRKLLKKSKKVKLRMSLSGTTGNASLTATATKFVLSAPK